MKRRPRDRQPKSARARGPAASAVQDSSAPGTVRPGRVAAAQAPPEVTAAGGGRVLGSLWSATKLASGVLIVVAASVAVAWGAHHYALTSPRFAVRQLEVDGNQRKTDAQVAKLAGVDQGVNIFALDVDNAVRKLLEDPWIRDAKLTRQLPGTVRIELTEREAAALAAIDGPLYLLTSTGEPFKQLEPGEDFDLPVVTGIRLSDLRRNRQGEVARVAVGLQVLRHYERLPMSKVYPAQEVHLRDGGDVVLTVGKQGIALHLGRGPWKKKLLMAARVTERLRRRGRIPGIVFLDNQAHPERVVVRMR